MDLPNIIGKLITDDPDVFNNINESSDRQNGIYYRIFLVDHPSFDAEEDPYKLLKNFKTEAWTNDHLKVLRALQGAHTNSGKVVGSITAYYSKSDTNFDQANWMSNISIEYYVFLSHSATNGNIEVYFQQDFDDLHGKERADQIRQQAFFDQDPPSSELAAVFHNQKGNKQFIKPDPSFDIIRILSKMHGEPVKLTGKPKRSK